MLKPEKRMEAALRNLKPVVISGREVLPIVEGGKGVGASNGKTAGAFAAAGAVGTFSGVNGITYDETGAMVPVVYRGTTRREKHEELVAEGIKAAIKHAQVAHETSNGQGRVHVNVLWEMGGCERVLEGALEGAKGLIHGVTCGAGMPYRLSDIAAKYNVHYHPIISSMRAFRALWKRAYSRTKDLLGSVVYEDPWLAGGHNGLSNGEDPTRPEDPYPRVRELRKFMNEVGLHDVPIIMAGGVWWLEEWEDWIDNPDLGPIAFQFGTRPLLTQESPISGAWKQRLLTLKPGDVLLQPFSPTGFYSSAVRNEFLHELEERNERQVAYTAEAVGEHLAEYGVGPRKRPVFVAPHDLARIAHWEAEGFTEAMRTPDNTLIFVTPDKSREIVKDQVDCMGCLSACRFSNWSQHEPDFDNGRRADPRSFCIQKTLQDVSHDGALEKNLMFAGHNAYRFGADPFYSNGFIPSAKQLVERILTGR